MGLDSYLTRIKKNSSYKKSGKTLGDFDSEGVAHWTNAHAIHNWFVESVQRGVDDQGSYEVSKPTLQELLTVCDTVLQTYDALKALGDEHTKEVIADLVYVTKPNVDAIKKEYGENVDFLICKRADNYQLLIFKDKVDTDTIERLLPSQNRFLKGDEVFDKDFIVDIKDTIKIVTDVLETTDFNTEAIIYSSWW